MPDMVQLLYTKYRNMASSIYYHPTFKVLFYISMANKKLITLQSPPEQMLELVATSPVQMDQKEAADHLD